MRAYANQWKVALGISTCLLAACGSDAGGGDDPGDGGVVLHDSLDPSFDGNSPPADSASGADAKPGTDATPSTDSAPPGSDSSPGTDSAPGVDTGTPPPTDAGPPAKSGYLRTDGAKIVDASGSTVRLTGLSWFGMETSNYAPHGLWSRSLGSMLDQVKSLGYNTLRIPYSNAIFDSANVPNGIDLGKNPDLAKLSALQILDKIVAGAKARGLKIILDRHRPDASAQSELWYTSSCSEAKWIDDWKTLAKRYAGDPTVIGADLHNEPHGPATWGDGSTTTDWRLAAERGGNAILGVEPDWLIFVEGIEKVGSDGYWWGGNLKNAGASPVRLSVAHRLVYSIHDYPSSVSAQSWFSDAKYPANLADVWDAHWGYLVRTGVAPVWIGEFGTKYATDSDKKWLGALVDYEVKNGLSFAFWSLNPNSGDTGGILLDDWTSVATDKQAAVAKGLAPMLP